MADGGTLFLDEIGELHPHIQVKLLDFIENQRFTAVGGVTSQKVNTRIITATNKDLTGRIKENKFREDLYWRINGISETIPSLRSRKSDILPIAQYYLKQYNQTYHTNKIFASQVLNDLVGYPWPGNIRQLKNAVEQMAVMSIGNLITEEHLPEQVKNYIREQGIGKESVFDDMVEKYKKSIIEDYFSLYQNTAELARVLGLSQTTAYRLVNKYIKEKQK